MAGRYPKPPRSRIVRQGQGAPSEILCLAEEEGSQHIGTRRIFVTAARGLGIFPLPALAPIIKGISNAH